MKYLRPRSADSGLVTVLLVSDAELDGLIRAVSQMIGIVEFDVEELAFKKLRAELKTARKAL